MTLEDTIPLMTSSDYKERLRLEYFQIKIRCEKLSRFVKRIEDGKIDLPYPYTLLEGQLKAMRSYRDFLRARIDIEQINLEE